MTNGPRHPSVRAPRNTLLVFRPRSPLLAGHPVFPRQIQGSVLRQQWCPPDRAVGTRWWHVPEETTPFDERRRLDDRSACCRLPGHLVQGCERVRYRNQGPQTEKVCVRHRYFLNHFFCSGQIDRMPASMMTSSSSRSKNFPVLSTISSRVLPSLKRLHAVSA